MSIDWHTIGQEQFDRIVEALINHKYRGADIEVIALDGRGGDGGVDIEVRQDGRVIIFQLKYFPEGFSGGWKTRRTQIKRSFAKLVKTRTVDKTCMVDEWVLVVPRNLTPGEHAFVTGLGKTATTPSTWPLGRKDLDDLLIEFPEIDRWAQRNVHSELRDNAATYNRERDNLLHPDDLSIRVSELGALADSTDLNWATDFARVGDVVTHTLRAKNSRSQENSPILVSFKGSFGPQHAALREQFERSTRFGASGEVVLPAEIVGAVTITGPELVAGVYTGMEVRFEALSSAAAIGAPAELRFFDDHGAQVISHEGRISHLTPGSHGFAMRIDFFDHLQVELLSPKDVSQPGHADISYNLRRIRPADALGVEEILTAINQPDLRCRVYIDDKLLVSLSFEPPADADIDDELDAVFRLAYDLKVVQEHCRSSFDLPEALTPLERINLRVARLLLEGYAVASPEAPGGVVILNGSDSPHLRQLLAGEDAWVSFTAQSFTFSVGAKELTLTDVLVFHPRATARNGTEALAAMENGKAEGFRLNVAPSNEPYFYLALSDRLGDPVPPVSDWKLALWSLPGITQPGPHASTADGPDEHR
ncbi:hypothetical protein [Nocardia alba]|uniref:Restriction endonuclease n=1 Tax=Nocardia alba TaxID=225051 RepID=A0A4R1FB02_9NOCA|nr:hypothetical protein [Nocardia alba]TCJ89869.1 hypothetical protein DFR71_6158 [Nocardia alba]